jgi:hypothetical protein
MKKLVRILICIVLTAGYVVRPVAPFIEYVIRKNYIEKNLCINRDVKESCCHGKCYLDRQLAKTQEERPSDKENNPGDNRNKLVDDHLFSVISPVLPAENKVFRFYEYDAILVNSISDPPFIPPKG